MRATMQRIPYSSTDRRLLKHLVWALAVKLAALYLLWHAFVASWRVTVDTDAIAHRWQSGSDSTFAKEIPRHD
jgi:hypothetical protein